jgi:integrase
MPATALAVAGASPQWSERWQPIYRCLRTWTTQGTHCSTRRRCARAKGKPRLPRRTRAMQTYRPRPVDDTKILTRREMPAVLADLKRRARRSKNTRMNLVLFRLASCCGLRASEIAKLQVADVRSQARLQKGQGAGPEAIEGHGEVDPELIYRPADATAGTVPRSPIAKEKPRWILFQHNPRLPRPRSPLGNRRRSRLSNPGGRPTREQLDERLIRCSSRALGGPLVNTRPTSKSHRSWWRFWG